LTVGLKVKRNVDFSLLPTAHFASANKDCDGFARAKNLFKPRAPTHTRHEIPAIQERLQVFIPDFPRDFFDQGMIG
jgi:hypothetical protein